MPLIPYPSVAHSSSRPGAVARTRHPPIQRSSLELTNPSRITHIAPATDDQITIDRAPSRWRLSLTFDLMRADSPMARAVQRFLAQMEDSDNYADFPLGARAPSWTGTTTISSISSNTITLASVPTGMAEGDFIRVGPRLAMIEDLAGALQQITIRPRPLGAAGETISPGTHWRGRLQGNAQYSAPSAGGFFGPVALNLIEVI